MAIGQRAAALRLQVETALAGRVVAPLEYRDRTVVETVSGGIAEIDELTGGLPRGCLTEVFGGACSGRSSLLQAALAARTQEGEICALVDGRDAFDPATALLADVHLQQLLWVRCKNIEQALRATDLLIQGGGFGMIALDLSDIAPRLVRKVPLNMWFRFRRAVENTQTVFVLIAQESNAKTCASLVLHMEGEAGVWRETAAAQATSRASSLGKKATVDLAKENAEPSEGCLLESVNHWAEVVRSRIQAADGRPKTKQMALARVFSIEARQMESEQKKARTDAAAFQSSTGWSFFT